MANPPDNETLLMILLATLLRSEWDDDPYVRELIYSRFRKQHRLRESWGPELEELLFGLPRRPRRREETREIATSVLEGFRTSFEDSVGKRIEELSTRVDVLEENHARLTSGTARRADDLLATKHTLHDFIWMVSSGVNIESASTARYVPVRLFLGAPVPGEESRERLLDALLGLLKLFGFERSYELPAESGSWWKRLFLRTQDLVTQDEVKKRLETAERAVTVNYLDKPQAEANSLQAAAAADLINALNSAPNACIQVGTLLLVKVDDGAGNSDVVVRTLTQEELKRLEARPLVLMQPGTILESLR